MVRVLVPATTANLGPGYDCLGLALNLFNTLEMAPAREWNLTIRGEGQGTLREDETNLAWRSMCKLWQETGTSIPVVNITMTNQIPPGRGLGSSAAAIVGALLAANYWAGQPLTQDELLQMAAELEGHPDNVAPALMGGLTVSVSACRRVTVLKLDFPNSLKLVACIPEFRLATSEARQVLPAAVTHEDAVFNLSRTALLVGALAQGRADLLGLACQDRLHQDYPKDLIPGFDQVAAAAREAGALACMLSGAGPTMLALAPADADSEGIGRAMVSAFAGAGVGAEYSTLTPELRGARVI